MNTVVHGPARRYRVAVLAGVLLVLSVILQWGITTASAGPDVHVHVLSASSTPLTPLTEDGAPGRAHIQAAPPDRFDEPLYIIAVPRNADNSPRLPMVAGFAEDPIRSAAVVVAEPASPRPPPHGALPIS
ncbi:hypothetical protein EF834_08370 [Rhodococcus spongiicola]|uniref:Uncharacterized protein n=1 Tax=Rhodococcus spongiicola TaxID=2487352 RepID=A0A438AWU1_9NOCA|nr:hypothetical protein EF834_08370 [Rhodococcus spongiicola]